MSCDECNTCKHNKFKRVCQILDEHNNDSSKLIPILHEVQREYKYLPEDILSYIAMTLDLPAAKVYGVASFYAHFALEPKGKYVISVCDGTACHGKGSMKIYDALKEKLGLSDGAETTDDMKFTLQTVSCLGACGMAPVMTINEKVHGQVTPDAAVKLIEDIIEKEQA